MEKKKNNKKEPQNGAPVFHNKYTFKKKKPFMSEKPSMTLPDRTYTIQELVYRQTKDMTEMVRKDGVDTQNDHDGIDLEKFFNADIVEKKEITRNHKQQHQYNLQQAQKTADEAAQKAEEAVSQQNNTIPPQQQQTTVETKNESENPKSVT